MRFTSGKGEVSRSWWIPDVCAAEWELERYGLHDVDSDPCDGTAVYRYYFRFFFIRNTYVFHLLSVVISTKCRYRKFIINIVFKNKSELLSSLLKKIWVVLAQAIGKWLYKSNVFSTCAVSMVRRNSRTSPNVFECVRPWPWIDGRGLWVRQGRTRVLLRNYEHMETRVALST